MSYRSDLVIYMPLERLNGFKDKFPYQCKIVFLKEPGRESVLLKFDYLPGSIVDDMINTIKTYGYWEYVAVGEDFQIEQETSTDYDFYLEPNIKVEAKVPNCETREFKMW